MHTNDYNKAKIIKENSNKNFIYIIINNNYNYKTNKYNSFPYNYNNNIITEKNEELIKDNKPEIIYNSSKVETWGDLTNY